MALFRLHQSWNFHSHSKKNFGLSKEKEGFVQVLIWRKVQISSWYQNIAKLLVMEEVLITWKIVDLVFVMVSFVGSSFSNLALLLGNFDSSGL